MSAEGNEWVRRLVESSKNAITAKERHSFRVKAMAACKAELVTLSLTMGATATKFTDSESSAALRHKTPSSVSEHELNVSVVLYL